MSQRRKFNNDSTRSSSAVNINNNNSNSSPPRTDYFDPVTSAIIADYAGLYHEKQHLQMCALHALNNFFSRKEFSKTELDKICTDLTPSSAFNPHRSWLGLGNYDVNVMTRAFESRRFVLKWFNKAVPMDAQIDRDTIVGFIVNVDTSSAISQTNELTRQNHSSSLFLAPLNMFRTKQHWYALVKRTRMSNTTLDVFWFNVDSKLPAPRAIGGWKQLDEYFHDYVMLDDSCHLFYVITEDDDVCAQSSSAAAAAAENDKDSAHR